MSSLKEVEGGTLHFRKQVYIWAKWLIRSALISCFHIACSLGSNKGKRKNEGGLRRGLVLSRFFSRSLSLVPNNRGPGTD